MALKCIIVDDEVAAIDQMIQYVEGMPGYIVQKTYTNPVLALLEINKDNLVDVIFLDIEMPDYSGIELGRQLRPFTKYLIFITAHQSFAVDAFDVRADHFLLKPFSFERFASAVNKVIQPAGLKAPVNATFIKGGNKNDFIHINFDDVLYMEAMKNYIKIFLNGKNANGEKMAITYMSIGEMEGRIDEQEFIRISRSLIVSKSKIVSVQGNVITLQNGTHLGVVGQYKTGFYNYISANALLSKNVVKHK